MKKTNISIIIPIYNTPVVRIEKLFNSIKNAWDYFQEKNNLNTTIILVNDGSTKTDICNFIEVAELDNIKIQKVKLKFNVGRSNARNIGIQESERGWITFLDSDDQVLKNYFETIFEYLSQYPNLHQISFGYFINNIQVMRYSNIKPVKYEDFRYKNIWSTFINLEFLNPNTDIRFDSTLDAGEDFDFLKKLEMYSIDDKMMHVNIPIYRYLFDYKSYKKESFFKSKFRWIYYQLKYRLINFLLKTPLIS